MLISKKFLKYTYFEYQGFTLKIQSKKKLYLLFIPVSLAENIKVLNQSSLKLKSDINYEQSYIFKFNLNTKYLFLFTIYVIYSKLNTVINSFFFQFNILSIKQKKFTILRAPCNHKNSKEQYGLTRYSAKLISNCPFKQNKFYNNFIILSYFTEKMIGLTELTLKFYRKKNVS